MISDELGGMGGSLVYLHNMCMHVHKRVVINIPAASFTNETNQCTNKGKTASNQTWMEIMHYLKLKDGFANVSQGNKCIQHVRT